jgi:cell division protein FtsB
MPALRNLKYIVISGIFIFISISLIKSTLEVVSSSKRLVDSNTELARLENKKQQLERDIEYKKTDEYVEERARNDLNLIKPGEKAYVLVYSDSKTESPLNDADRKKDRPLETTPATKGASNTRESVPDSTWYKWYKLFF